MKSNPYLHYPKTQYERTDPDYDTHRIKRMRAELSMLSTQSHREMYLAGLSALDRRRVLMKGSA